jgi:uncharacterized protein (DUF433 family)
MKITHTEGVCGGRACLAGTRIPVWTIVALALEGAPDKEVQEAFRINETQLFDACKYARDNQSEIIADIRDNTGEILTDIWFSEIA